MVNVFYVALGAAFWIAILASTGSACYGGRLVGVLTGALAAALWAFPDVFAMSLSVPRLCVDGVGGVEPGIADSVERFERRWPALGFVALGLSFLVVDDSGVCGWAAAVFGRIRACWYVWRHHARWNLRWLSLSLAGIAVIGLWFGLAQDVVTARR
jgi:hypothetical protein